MSDESTGKAVKSERAGNSGCDPGRVLVVVDQANMCWVLERLLLERGHCVCTAQNGAEALAAADASGELGFHVAIVDYRLPDTDGLALIEALVSRLPRLLSILMTSYGTSALKHRVEDAGVCAYVTKPFNNHEMVRTVEMAVRAGLSGVDSLTRGTDTRTMAPASTVARS